MTSSIASIADGYVERYATLDPVAATAEGISGHDTELTDYSPDGIAQRLTLCLEVARELDEAPVTTDADRITATVLRDDLQAQLDLLETDEDLRPLRVIGSPVSDLRMCFDLMDRETDEDWEILAARVAVLPQSIDSLIASLREGVRTGVVAAQRQAVVCARQADTWGGHDPETPPFFLGLVDEYDESTRPDPALRRHLADGASRATDAYAALGRFLVEDYLPHASPVDAVGADRYARWSRRFTGTDLDFAEAYAWGWEELHRIEQAMHAVAARILPGEPLLAVIDHLEHDPRRSIEGAEELRTWLQGLIDRTVTELDGTHFDIPEPVRRVDAMIAPPGGAAAMYYTGPSEDFSRPGRTWYPTQGRTHFPLWGEVSICYHEAVPGHHLQVGMTRYLADRLTRYQRTLAWNSGHGEGWALYAERLMGELGYLDEDPAYELGMLRAQAMRAARVIIDIGLHLELPIPASELDAGECWKPERARSFLGAHSYFPEGFVESEIDSYLGLPAQAISYKVGERVWLASRDDARRSSGADFDLKAFHSHALALGPMGLDALHGEITRRWSQPSQPAQRPGAAPR